MPDPFDGFAQSLTSPATLAVPVTPNDATDLSMPSRALNVAEGGAVRITTTGGTVATLQIAPGVAFPVRATRIWATGTTATGVVALI